jgi:hypothetical protein
MLLHEGNIPQPNALIRYETYEKFIQDTWRDQGQRPRLRSWISLKPRANIAFSPGTVYATNTLREVRAAIDRTYASVYISSLSKNICGFLAALDIAVTSRVCNEKLLTSVLHGDVKHLCLLYRNGNAFIEYSDVPIEVKDRPVSRFMIPSRSAAALFKTLGAGKQLLEVDLASNALANIMNCEALRNMTDRTVDKVLSCIADHVNNENALEMPGIASGVLSGRVATFSLDRNDWYRATTNLSWQPADRNSAQCR